MKRKTALIVGVIALAIGVTVSAETVDHLSFYRQMEEDLNIIQIYSHEEITPEIMENRAEEGKIIIESVIGTVLDDDGNGSVLESGEFISYRYTDGAKKGDMILSYFLYSPDSNEPDDVLVRFDYIIDRPSFNVTF